MFKQSGILASMQFS